MGVNLKLGQYALISCTGNYLGLKRNKDSLVCLWPQKSNKRFINYSADFFFPGLFSEYYPKAYALIFSPFSCLRPLRSLSKDHTVFVRSGFYLSLLHELPFPNQSKVAKTNIVLCPDQSRTKITFRTFTNGTLGKARHVGSHHLIRSRAGERAGRALKVGTARRGLRAYVCLSVLCGTDGA